MKCPHCGGRTRIWKTRAADNGSVLRERRCTRRACRAQFVTVEVVQPAYGSRISQTSVQRGAPESLP
jgi:transcriptional regulator NrdR family protein